MGGGCVVWHCNQSIILNTVQRGRGSSHFFFSVLECLYWLLQIEYMSKSLFNIAYLSYSGIEKAKSKTSSFQCFLVRIGLKARVLPVPTFYNPVCGRMVNVKVTESLEGRTFYISSYPMRKWKVPYEGIRHWGSRSPVNKESMRGTVKTPSLLVKTPVTHHRKAGNKNLVKKY